MRKCLAVFIKRVAAFWIIALAVTKGAEGQVAPPTLTPSGGVAGTIQQVSISSSGASAIYYTMDGSSPSTSAIPYSSPVLVGRSLVLKAIAYSGTTASAITSGTYTISGDIGVGFDHVLVLQYNGNVYGWGSNSNGQLGNGTTATAQTSPVSMGPDINGNPFGNIVALAGGVIHSVMLSGSGTVWACGDDAYGELGNGATADKHSPVQVELIGGTSILTNIASIDSSGYFSVAVGSTVSPGVSNVYAWGYNADGECGIGQVTSTYVSKADPVRTSNTGPTYLSGVTQVSCGSAHTAALSGTAVWTWGDNADGQMALPSSTTQNTVAKQVAGLPSVVAVGGGGHSVFAITSTNTAMAWGYNNYGQLGINSTTGINRTPTLVVTSSGTPFSNVVSIDSSTTHTLFLKGDGTVWASGSNSYGELGNGATAKSLYPVQVMLNGTTPLSNIVSIGAGVSFSVALGASGTVYVWGINTDGELCNGSTTNSTNYYARAATSAPTLTDVPPSINLSYTMSQTIQPASITLSPSGAASSGLSEISYYENSTLEGSGTSYSPFTISNLPAGSYGFLAVATDIYGASGTSNTINVTVPLPTVTGSSIVSLVPISSGSSGDFRLTRNGPAGAPLTVTYTIAGTAVPGVDYNALPGSVTIASGASSADIYVTPIVPGSAGWEKDVALTVTGTAYNINNGTADIVLSNSQYTTNNSNYWYLRGTGTNNNTADYSYIVPLDLSVGYVPFATGTGNPSPLQFALLGGYALLQPAAVTGTATGAWPSGAPWFLQLASSGTTYHLAAMNGSGQPTYPASLGFNNPLVAFGSRAGGTPLYTGQPYSFGLESGGQNLNPSLSGTLQDLRIDVYAQSSFVSGTASDVAPIVTQMVHLPRPGEPDWDAFARSGFQMPLTVTATSGTSGTGTFNINVSYATSGFGGLGAATKYPIEITVNASSAAYYLRFSVKGAVLDSGGNWDWMAVDNPSNPAGTGDYSASFTMDFTNQGLAGWQSTVLNQPNFAGTTQLPAAYQGMSEQDLLDLAPIVTGSDSLPASVTGTLQSQWLTTGTNIAAVTSPELVDNPILDSFVTSMNSDPLALANYVQNEIGVVDPMGLPNASGTINYTDQSVNFGGVNRSALGVLLEGQGSPVEQCGLLVYLLRRAGVPCAYAFGKLDQTQMLTSQLSEILHMQLNGAEDFGVSESTTGPTLTSVNYPWVAAYINGQWVHLFPWIKDTVVDEGYDLYDFMPPGYQTGAEWVRQYLYNDPNIRTPGTEDYQDPGILFPEFVQNNLPPYMSIDDIGVSIYNRRHYYSSWSQFPHPWSRPGVSSANLYTDLMTYSKSAFGSDSLFDTASIEVFSDRFNSGVYVSGDPMVESGTLYTALLNDRRFLLYHTPAGSYPTSSGTTAWGLYNMNLSLESATPIATGTNTVAAGSPFSNTGGDPYLLNKQFSSVSLTGSDHNLCMIINQTRHRAAESSNGGLPFLSLEDGSPSTDVRPLQVGDTAGICFNFGQVTHWMLEVQEDKYWALQQQLLQNPNGSFDIETAQGLPCYLMGMSYFYREGGFINQYQALTKMEVISQVAHGLAKLSPARISGSATMINGALNLRYPNVDMFHYNVAWAGNATVDPGSGAANSTTWADYMPVFIVASSAQEHLTIQQFFGPENDDAISTVKLMDIARGLTLTGTTYTYTGVSPQETVTVDPVKGITVTTGTTTLCVTGSGGMIELNSENYQALGQLQISGTYDNGLVKTGTTASLSWWATQAGIWTTATNAFSSSNSPELHRVFITPGPVSGAFSGSGSSQQAAYYGMGALIYGVYDAAAVISPNMNGGFGGDDGSQFSYSPLTLQSTAMYDSFSSGDDSGPSVLMGDIGAGNAVVPIINAPQDIEINTFGSTAGNILTTGAQVDLDIQTAGTITGADGLLLNGNPSALTQPSGIVSGLSTLTNSGVFGTGIWNALQAVAEPVNTVTGAFYSDNVDLKLNGPMPLEIRRNYNSQDPFSGAFGYGWKMSMVPYLVVSTDSNQTLIYAAEKDGSVLTYRRTSAASSTWLVSGSDNPQYINPQSTTPGAPNLLNNQIAVSTSGTNTIYTLAGADGSLRTFKVESFSTAGGTNGLTLQRPYLQKWQDNRGNYFLFAFGTDPTQVNYGQLISIQASNGNYAGFIYDTYGHVTQAFTGDGCRTYYQYDDYGDLTQVTLPDGSTITYTYRHEPNATGGHYSEHLLTKENKPGGRVLENYYDYFGFRRVLVQKSTVQQGNSSPIQNAAFSYAITGLTNNTSVVLSGTTFQTGATLNLSASPITGGYASVLTSGTINLTSSALLSGSMPLPPTALTSGTTTLTDVNNNNWYYGYANGLFTQNISPPQNNGSTPQVVSQTWASAYATAGGGVYPGSLMSQTDKRGLVTTYQYDTEGNLLQKTVQGNLKGDGNAGETATTSYTYNSSVPVAVPGSAISLIPNTIASITDPLGNSVAYTYGSTSYPYLPTAVTKGTPSGTVSTEILNYVNSSDGSGSSYGLLNQDTVASGSPDQAETSVLYGGNGFPTQRTVYSETSDPNIVTTYTYNLRGQVVSETDAAGRSTEYRYDARGNTTGILRYDQNGSLAGWQFNYYNLNGEVEWTQGPRYAPDDYVQTEYDGAGRISMVNKWRTAALASGSGVANAGYATTFNSYDSFGNQTQVQDPNGNLTSVTYDAIGEMLTRQTPNGSYPANESFTYEPGGKVASHITVLGGTEGSTYTTTGLPATSTRADGSTESYLYDLTGRVVQDTLSNGSYWTISYNDYTRTVSRTFYNSSGVQQGTETQTSDRRGNVISSTDLAGNTFTTSYDGLNRQKSFTGPPAASPGGAGSTAQQTTYNTYDNAGLIQTGSNALGEKTVTSFDPFERPVKVITYNAGGGVATNTQFIYAANHQSITTIRGSGTNGVSVSETQYTDTFGKPVLLQHADGTFQATAYDANENEILFQDELGHATTWTYDALNHPLSKTLPTDSGLAAATTSYTYNAAGELLSQQMPESLTSITTYDSAGRRRSAELTGSSGALTRNYGYTYYSSNSPSGAANGLLATVADPRGFTTTTTYDAWMRPSTVDSSGSPVAQQNQNTTYQYDPRGMVNYVAQSYVSDAAGPSTLVTRGYDGYGQINQETVQVSGSTVSDWHQSWDAAGRRVGLNWQMPAQGIGAGSQYAYSYNAAGLMTDIVNNNSSYSYSYGDNGLLSERDTPMNTEIYTRDSRGRIQNQTSSYGSTLLSETVGYRGDSRLTSYIVSGLLEANGTLGDYQYDARGQVYQEPYLSTGTNGATSNQVANYLFDVPITGGSSSFTVGGFNESGLGVRQVQGVGTNPNLTTWQFASLVNHQNNFQQATQDMFSLNSSYDAAGNLAGRTFASPAGTGTTSFTWDAWGRLVGVSQVNSGGYYGGDYAWSSVYDGLSRRVQTTQQPAGSASSYLNYMYDPQVEFMELGVNSNGGDAWRVYGPDRSGVYGGDEGVGGIEAFVYENNGTVYGQVNDYFGDTVGALYWYDGEVGLLASEGYGLTYGGYGPEPGTSLYSSINGYPMPEWRGRYPDMTGFTYMGARYLDFYGQTGRFLSPDPMGNEASMSLYDYCAGDPVNGLDPDGRFGKAALNDVSNTINATTSIALTVAQNTPGAAKMALNWTGEQVNEAAQIVDENGGNQIFGDGGVMGFLQSIAPVDSALGTLSEEGNIVSTVGETAAKTATADGAVAEGATGTIELGNGMIVANPVAAEGTTFIRCFPPGTQVLMADGKTKAIEKIKKGDEVFADDPTSSEKPTKFKVVAELRNYTEHLVTIEAKDSSNHVAHFKATREHPFWVKAKGWKNAKDLTKSDVLVDKTGKDVRVLRVSVEGKESLTYNLTIDQKHTFYIVDNGVTVLVHNASPFQIGTYGSLQQVGDGLAAHEVLPDAYLQAIGFNTTGARLFSNPAIALSPDIHIQINATQTQWGIRNPDYLSSLTPEEVIHQNYEFMTGAGVPEEAAQQVSENALNYVKQLGIQCP